MSVVSLAMRIWDIEPGKLCQKHLLGEHRELHAIWTILTQDKKGYRNHPETKRWEGKLKALFNRHQKLVDEMQKRSYNHRSELDVRLATGSEKQDEFVHTIREQLVIIKNKNCECKI